MVVLEPEWALLWALLLLFSAGAASEQAAAAAGAGAKPDLEHEPASHGHGHGGARNRTGAAFRLLPPDPDPPDPIGLWPFVITGHYPLASTDYTAKIEGRAERLLVRVWAKKSGAIKIQESFIALSRTVPAAPYWNKRVQLVSFVRSKGLPPQRKDRYPPGAFAFLFLRVRGGGEARPTLLFDNMQGRRITGWLGGSATSAVVRMDVPGPPDPDPDESCPNPDADPEAAVPTWLQFGIGLCGGSGEINFWLADFILETVTDQYATSEGLPPWMPPGPDDL